MENIIANEVMDDVIEMENVTDVVAAEVAYGEPVNGNGLKVALGIGLGVAVGVLVYKTLIKPAIAKRKAKKASKATEEDVNNVDIDELFDDETM